MHAPSAGSIIFSQSVLAIRSGVRTRLQGLTLAAAQLVMFVLPFSLVHLLPNFYYGALLAVLGIDICREWLWNTRTRITAAEFALSWLSFCATITLTSLMPVQVRFWNAESSSPLPGRAPMFRPLPLRSAGSPMACVDGSARPAP